MLLRCASASAPVCDPRGLHSTPSHETTASPCPHPVAPAWNPLAGPSDPHQSFPDRLPLPGAVRTWSRPLTPGGPLPLPPRPDRSFPPLARPPAVPFSFLATACGVAHLRGSRLPIGHKWPSRPPAMPDFIPLPMAWLRPRPGPSVCWLFRVLHFVSKQKTSSVFLSGYE